MPPAKHPTRKRTPKHLAVIDRDCCTGCEACIAICPVDCISLQRTGLGVMGTELWCEIDVDRCIGCALCVHLPRRKTEPYLALVCPWEAIQMVPSDQLQPVSD